MKQKILAALILTNLVGLSAACWSPKEANEYRSSSPTPASTVSSVSPTADSKNTNMTNKNVENLNSNKPRDAAQNSGFKANLPANFQMPTDDVGLKLLSEYGSICLASGGAVPPNKIIFRDEADVSAFQSSAPKSTEKIGAFTVELQTPAMNALKKAITEAQAAGKNITPRAADSSKRTYGETVSLWKSRVEPGLAYWVKQGKLPQAEADRIKNLSPFDQVSEILKLESQGMYFSKDLSKSILYSVAAPGASQHIFMLALDVEQFSDPKVREILANNGWFQTVLSDLPHFTYLGLPESELSAKGLKSVMVGSQKFWIPNI